MKSQGAWICDGVPKNSSKQYTGTGTHTPRENYGTDCLECGLPREALLQTTTISGKSNKSVSNGKGSGNSWIPTAAAIVAIVILGIGGLWWYITRPGSLPPDNGGNPAPTNSPQSPADPLALLSQKATSDNSPFISQGERVLLTDSLNAAKKTEAANSFLQKNWNEAISQYQSASDADPNDPEGKIYLNNAKAKQAGNPLAMAVVVPVSPSPAEAKEVLRGVAQAQDEFNRTRANQLLEVVLINDDQSGRTLSLVDDIIKFPNILGVLGHGVDDASRQAIVRYEQSGLAILSPVSVNISVDGGQPTLKTVSFTFQAQELFDKYLRQVSESLIGYVTTQQQAPSAVIFYNTDSPYSQALKTHFNAALGQKGKILKEIDVTSPGFDAASEIASAKQAGANVAFLALSKNKVSTALSIANANSSPPGQPLLLLGADELYSPTTLAQGGNAINGMVLAVPWSWQANDPFAEESYKIWKGRISWRTTTSYDATQALTSAFVQNPNRSKVLELLRQGIPIAGKVTEYSVFNTIPLVKAVPGKGGPAGSRYRFDPL